MINKNSKDQKTSDAFANSWNNLDYGSIYNFKQFKDWMEPLTKEDIQNKRVLELGCGNASLMLHLSKWNPSFITGVDLGASVISAQKNMELCGFSNYKIIKHDLTSFDEKNFDVVYCIGVLHHLQSPIEGLKAVVRNTRSKGSFHCWVYAKEGNTLVRIIVEPLRKITSKLPWWITKYLFALPLSIPFFLYSKTLKTFKSIVLLKHLPLYDYSLWISQRDFNFYRHVVFDQLVTPQTAYLSKDQIKEMLNSISKVNKETIYIIKRNGNSWKFGAKIK